MRRRKTACVFNDDAMNPDGYPSSVVARTASAWAAMAKRADTAVN